jgi:hypothetical protein
MTDTELNWQQDGDWYLRRYRQGHPSELLAIVWRNPARRGFCGLIASTEERFEGASAAKLRRQIYYRLTQQEPIT